MIEDLEPPIYRKAPSTLPEPPHELVLALAAEEADKVALAALALDLVRHVGEVLEPVGGDHLQCEMLGFGIKCQVYDLTYVYDHVNSTLPANRPCR